MTFAGFDQLTQSEKATLLFNCCGSSLWVNKMLTVFPVDSLADLFHHVDEKWAECGIDDYLEAFSQHPKIGDVTELKKKFASTATWAAGEQAGVSQASDELLLELAEGDKQYEQKFGYIFIVCATGKSAGEMAKLLKIRLSNSAGDELKIAAAEQAKITRIRLQKLFA